MLPEKNEFGHLEPLGSSTVSDDEYKAYVLQLRQEIASYMLEEGKFVFYTRVGCNAMCYVVKKTVVPDEKAEGDKKKEHAETFDFNIQAIVPQGYSGGFVDSKHYWRWKHDTMIDLHKHLSKLLFPQVNTMRKYISGLGERIKHDPLAVQKEITNKELGESVHESSKNTTQGLFGFRTNEASQFGTAVLLNDRGVRPLNWDAGEFVSSMMSSAGVTTDSGHGLSQLTKVVGELVEAIKPVLIEKVPQLTVSAEKPKSHKWTPPQKKLPRNKRKSQ